MQRLLPTLLAVVALLLLPCSAAPALYREPVVDAVPLSSRAISSPLDLVSQLSTCAVRESHPPYYHPGLLVFQSVEQFAFFLPIVL